MVIGRKEMGTMGHGEGGAGERQGKRQGKSKRERVGGTEVSREG